MLLDGLSLKFDPLAPEVEGAEISERSAHNEEVTVSLMTVKAGQRLSLQSHTGRAELWIALDDHAIIQVGEDIIQAQQGDEFWIPPNTKHRLMGGEHRSQVLEVAFGNWQQADIARYDDDYQRPEQGE